MKWLISRINLFCNHKEEQNQQEVIAMNKNNNSNNNLLWYANIPPKVVSITFERTLKMYQFIY